jgi:hypothetical protein
MRLVCLIVIVSISVFITAEAEQFIWVRNISGVTTNDPTAGNALAADSEGNVIVLGTLQGIADGPDHSVTNSGMFLKKFDVSGAPLWTRQASAVGSYIAVDGADNAYVCGSFFGTVSFETTMLTNADQYADNFLAKYDASGALQWVKQFPATGASCSAMAVDDASNIVLCGTFRGTVSFGATNLSSPEDHIYLAKLNNEGITSWVIDAVGGNPYAKFASSITANRAGDIFVTGIYYATTAFAATNITSQGKGDIFLARYNAAGDLIWVRSAGGPENDGANSVAVDGTNAVYVTGYFQSTAAFDTTNLTSSTGGLDAFVGKYLITGETQWLRQIADNKGSGNGSDVTVTQDGTVYVAGTFFGGLDLGVTNLAEKGYVDGFFARYTSAGQLVTALQGENINWSFGGRPMVVDAFGNLLWVGTAKQDSAFGLFGLTNMAAQAVLLKISESPALGIVQSNGLVTVSWSKAGVGYVLESADLFDMSSWTSLLNTASTPYQKNLSLPAASRRAFRLRSP